MTPLGLVAAGLAELVAAAAAGQPVTVGELTRLHRLAAGLDPYVERCTTPPSVDLVGIQELTRSEDWDARNASGARARLEQEMLSGHVEGQFLKTLVFATQAERILEIGTFTGYAALAMAEALPMDGCLVACEIDPGVAALARDRFEASAVGRRIDLRVGPALDTIQALSGEGPPFDLVFIDADKGGYRAYVDALLGTGQLARHGLICIDNTLLQGEPYLSPTEASPNGAAIATFNRWLAADPRVEQVLVPLRDGITLVRQVTT